MYRKAVTFIKGDICEQSAPPESPQWMTLSVWITECIRPVEWLKQAPQYCFFSDDFFSGFHSARFISAWCGYLRYFRSVYVIKCFIFRFAELQRPSSCTRMYLSTFCFFENWPLLSGWSSAAKRVGTVNHYRCIQRLENRLFWPSF